MYIHVLILGLIQQFGFARGNALESIKTSISGSPICSQIEGSISSASGVYYFGHPLYFKAISHWASSSAESSDCSVEPGNVEDLGTILKIVGSTRTPFAVKGNGRTTNPGFSSTSGVTIAMYRFSEITYDASSQTVRLGAGLNWDAVYEALAPYKVNVVGGVSTGSGVAGVAVNGGYSWLTNQHGLTADTAVEFELVKPDGTVVNVTESSDADLFWALKGGLNNFGVVTRLTLKTFPQGQVWGGQITYTSRHLDAVTAAVAKFTSTVTDPKANILTAYNVLLGQVVVSQLLFYDAPNPPPGMFDDFLTVPSLTTDVKTRDFLNMFYVPLDNATYGNRAVDNVVPLLRMSPSVLDTIVNETKFWGEKLALKSQVIVSYAVQTFRLPTASSSGSSWPPTRSPGYLPFHLYYGWALKTFDDDYHNAMRQTSRRITEAALADGQAGVDTAALYPGYAIFDTPAEQIWGESLGRLKEVKKRVDPQNVMGLTGGFKV
ncbi:hypothetical protein Moror_8217 [Moniliophthora roreri MCA 2997]|uniref:FAD-binding PCMH-type domain-containing protein n=2 Tax=Moniliophthora roreri TaxID=221103 RepID=V2XKT7_MONRO|nr:hypothetical protein Moror_8217 [Moniliophthora roreri MCA 2997]KAI3606421.1 hypothetical protein WG66_009562 [Moniliophthora roreri]